METDRVIDRVEDKIGMRNLCFDGGIALFVPQAIACPNAVGPDARLAASTDVAQVVISPAFPAALSPGALLQFSAFGLNSAGNIAQLVNPIVWTSTNSGVASIDQSGRLTAVAAGTTTVTGAYTNSDGVAAISGTATVTVQ